MAEDQTTPQGADFDGAPSPRRWWRWLILFAAVVPLVLAAVGAAGLWFLAETAAGRSFVARQISGIEPESGMRFEVARIDGSLFSRFSLHDVVVHDLDGAFATIPAAHVSWRPLSLFGRLVSLDTIEVPQARLLRMWRLNPGDPDAPLLPDIDIHVGRFDLSRIEVAEPVVGAEAVVTALGRVDIRAGRLLLDMQAATQTGDRMSLLLDAEPDVDKFDVKADMRAPQGGFVSQLSGMPQGMAAELSGAGTWDEWRGRLQADILPQPVAVADGGTTASEGEVARIADLAIMADAGRFRIQGELLPDAFLGESMARMTAPAVAVDATIQRLGDLLDLKFMAASDALSASGAGQLDVKGNRLVDVRAEMHVLRPELVDPALSGEALRAELTAEGPLRDARIAWTVRAAQIRYGEAGTDRMGVDGLEVSGNVVLPAEDVPFAVNFSGGVDRTVGLAPAVAELLENPRVSGVVTLADGGIRIGDLRANTRMLAATGTAAMVNGRLTAAIDGNLRRYEIAQLGPIAANARIRVDKPTGRAMTVSGDFTARSLGMSNEGVRDFLGGDPVVTGHFRMAGGGALFVERVNLQSPKLQFANAQARYDPSTGRFNLMADGRSADYGPVRVVAAGTADAPRATVTLASPGFGVGLVNVVAEVAPTEDGFLILATGQSPQGALDGRVNLVLVEGEPMVINIEQARFAGILARGRLVQTSGGPFAGRILVDGRGLDATVDLSAAGSVQQVVGQASARNARIPLDPVVAITSGQADFRILMTPGRPEIVGGFNLKGLRRDSLVLRDAAGKFDLKGTNGTGQVRLAGNMGSGKPFRAVIDMGSTPQGYTIGLSGTVDRQPLKLERPARIVVRGDQMELLPTRLVLPKGRIDIAGTWGAKRELRIRLDKVDMSAVDYMGGDFGLGGTASGDVAIRLIKGAAVPQGEANLRIDRLTRAGLTGISVPVDMVFTAQSTGDGLALGGRFSWQGNQLGRVVVRVTPGEGTAMTERFFNGRLSGGVRYNGPVEPLWAFVAPEGQELRGPVALGVDMTGTVANPVFSGVARGQGLGYRNAQFGTAITDIAFSGRFEGPYFRLANFSANAGKGTITGQGQVNLSPGDARQVRLAIQFDEARLANSDTMGAVISGPLRLDGQGSALKLSGDLRVDSARALLVQVTAADVPTLKVRRRGDVMVPPAEAAPPLLSAIELDVRVRANDVVRVEGMGLDSIWNADVRIRGTADAPRMFGRANLASGEFTFASSDFDITSGRLTLNGEPMDSAINIQAQTVAQDVTAYITIAGTAARPQISFSSTPSLPEDEILARLLFGTSVADLSVTEAVQLASAVAGLQSGMDTMGKIRRGIGLDRLRLVGENGQTGMGTGLAVGKRLSKNIYMEVTTDSHGNTLTSLQWTLSRMWSLIGEVASMGHSSVNARYQKEY